MAAVAMLSVASAVIAAHRPLHARRGRYDRATCASASSDHARGVRSTHAHSWAVVTPGADGLSADGCSRDALGRERGRRRPLAAVCERRTKWPRRMRMCVEWPCQRHE